MLSIDKETLHQWLNVDNLSYISISRKLETTIDELKAYAKSVGVQLPNRRYSRTSAWNTDKRDYICLNCGKTIPGTYGYRKYCSNRC